MKTSSLEILERSELPDAQARAILRVLEQEMASSQDNLATKTDVAALRAELKADMAALRAEMKADIAEFASKLSWMVLTCFGTQLAITVALAGVLYVRLGR
jgi:ribosome-interacting GTPase 1